MELIARSLPKVSHCVKGNNWLYSYHGQANRSTTTKETRAASRGYISTHVMLPRELIDWAKEQPEGLSGIVRQAISQEQKRRNVSA